MEINTLLREKLRNYRMLNASLAISSVMYGFVMVYIHLYAPMAPTFTDAEMIVKVEYALIAFALAAIFIGKTVREKKLASAAMFKETEASKRSPDQPPFLANYLSMLFIVWTIFETMSIAGITYFLVTGKIEIGLGLVAAAVLMKLLNGPRYEELTALASRADGFEGKR